MARPVYSWRGRLMRNSWSAVISAQCATQPAARAMANITVAGIETDILFSAGQQAEIVRGLRKAGGEAEFARLESIQGHDSFLVDAERFAPALRDFLDRT